MIRNQSLYPAELRGRHRFPPFIGGSAPGQAEQNGATRHSRAHWRHNPGHSPVIHHGTPLTPRAALLDVCRGRAMCVSFFRPDDTEVVEAISPAIMFRQWCFLFLDAGYACRRGMGRGSRLEPLLRLAGNKTVPSGPMGGHPRQSRRPVADQRRSAERLAVWPEGCAALAHGRADRATGATVRAARPGMSWMDRPPEERACGLRRLPSPDGRSGPAVRQSLAGHPHDARGGGRARLSLRQRGQHQPCPERVAV